MSGHGTTPVVGTTQNKSEQNKIVPTEEPVRPPFYAPEARDYPKSFFESFYTLLFGDPDRKWGPFRKHVRAAKKEGRWQEWQMKDIVEAEPEDGDDGSDSVSNERDRAKHVRSDRPYRMTEELKKDIRPARIDVEGLMRRNHHAGDYDDEFYQKHWENLYAMTAAWGTKWFDGNISLAYIQGRTEQASNQIWASNLTPQFIEYARLVAHEDLDHQGWPTALNDPVHRRWLTVGIMAQVLEKKIFNELLFGAHEVIEEELKRLDFKWVDKEGYGRKAVRAITARYNVEGRLLPHNFWPQVDELAARTVKIFLPLLNVLKEVRGDTRADYSLAAFTQEVHAIISYAGMIQVCMAISPSIFHLLSATPGARMDYGAEQQADMRPYRASKKYWEAEYEHWKEYVKAAMEGRSAVNHFGQPIQVPKDKTEFSEMDYHRTRGAKVRYAVFPKVTRYMPVNVGKGVPDEMGEGMRTHWEKPRNDIEGQEVIEISRCIVIYYQGLMYPEKGMIEAVTLKQHMDTLPSPDPNGLFGLVRMVVVASFSLLRKAFWHALVIGGLALGLYTTFMGVGYLRHLLFHFFIAILWAVTLAYNILDVFSRGKTLSPQFVIGIPFFLAYSYGAYYVYTAGFDALNVSGLVSTLIRRLTHI
ncbi:hypothetical protein F4776DRAFT_108409 [Hypoxylon sp. NC0597]|nr:hypothetical protein F4776DRAFT_108409 [Hypoxylon sp. NC0597]